MAKEKPTIINISFKTQTLDDKMLLDWLEVKFKEYGKSNYIKNVLREKMYKEINKEEQTKEKPRKEYPGLFYYIRCLNNSHNAANPK